MAAEELVLRPSKKRWSLILLGSATLAAGSVWMITTGAGVAMPVSFGDVRSWGVAGLILFGLGIPAALTQIFSGGNFLKLTLEGFTIGRLGSQTPYRWSDVREFSTEAVRSRGMTVGKRVVFDGVPAAIAGDRTLTAMMGAIGGRLPDTYGMKAEDLEALMNEWRTRHARPTA